MEVWHTLSINKETTQKENKMTTKYASKTTISPEKTKAEIESTLRRYGADQFIQGWEPGRGLIGFRVNGLPVRMLLPLPEFNDFEFYERKLKYGTRRERRSKEAQKNAFEQAERQRWRALLLVIKAKLEAVEAGITTIEQEFLANMVLPDNSTVAESLLPRLHSAVIEGKMPPMLPERSSYAE